MVGPEAKECPEVLGKKGSSRLEFPEEISPAIILILAPKIQFELLASRIETEPSSVILSHYMYDNLLYLSYLVIKPCQMAVVPDTSYWLFFWGCSPLSWRCFSMPFA